MTAFVTGTISRVQQVRQLYGGATDIELNAGDRQPLT